MKVNEQIQPPEEKQPTTLGRVQPGYIFRFNNIAIPYLRTNKGYMAFEGKSEGHHWLDGNHDAEVTIIGKAVGITYQRVDA